MHKLVGIIAASLLVFGSAHATPILVDPAEAGSTVSAEITSSNCLDCFVHVALSDDLDDATAMLDIGDSFTFDFFDIVVGGLIGTADIAVSATLALLSPDAVAQGNGLGTFASFLYIFNAIELTWSQPGIIELSDGTFLHISFEDLFEFGLGNTTTVSATISRVEAVPEPGTAALLLVGLMTIWLASRRRPFVQAGLSASSR